MNQPPRQGDRVRLSPDGLAANPELRNHVGVVVEVAEGVEVRWDDTELSCWLRLEYVQVCDGV